MAMTSKSGERAVRFAGIAPARPAVIVRAEATIPERFSIPERALSPPAVSIPSAGNGKPSRNAITSVKDDAARAPAAGRQAGNAALQTPGTTQPQSAQPSKPLRGKQAGADPTSAEPAGTVPGSPQKTMTASAPKTPGAAASPPQMPSQASSPSGGAPASPPRHDQGHAPAATENASTAAQLQAIATQEGGAKPVTTAEEKQEEAVSEEESDDKAPDASGTVTVVLAVPERVVPLPAQNAAAVPAHAAPSPPSQAGGIVSSDVGALKNAAGRTGGDRDTASVRDASELGPVATVPIEKSASAAPEMTSFSPMASAAAGFEPAPEPAGALPQTQVAPVPLGAVPMTIGLRSLAGSNRFEISLDPKDLGRIDVNLDIDKDSGTVTAHLTVDRPETLALLQRDVGNLQQALSQAGFDAGEAAINLSLRSDTGSDGGNGAERDGGSGRDGRSGTPGSDLKDPRLSNDAVPLRMLRGLGGIDIRI